MSHTECYIKEHYQSNAPLSTYQG